MRENDRCGNDRWRFHCILHIFQSFIFDGGDSPHTDLSEDWIETSANKSSSHSNTNRYSTLIGCLFCEEGFLLPLALQLTVGLGLAKNYLPFFPIRNQLSPSSHSQHLKISLYFLFPSFPGSSPSSRPFQLLSEDLFVFRYYPIRIFQAIILA